MLLQEPATNDSGGPEALEGHTHAGPGPRPEWGPGKRWVPTHLEGAWAERTGLGGFRGPGLTGNILSLGSIGTMGKRELERGMNQTIDLIGQ